MYTTPVVKIKLPRCSVYSVSDIALLAVVYSDIPWLMATAYHT